MLRYQVLITVKNVANQPQIPELAPVLIRKKTFDLHSRDGGWFMIPTKAFRGLGQPSKYWQVA